MDKTGFEKVYSIKKILKNSRTHAHKREREREGERERERERKRKRERKTSTHNSSHRHYEQQVFGIECQRDRIDKILCCCRSMTLHCMLSIWHLGSLCSLGCKPLKSHTHTNTVQPFPTANTKVTNPLYNNLVQVLIHVPDDTNKHTIQPYLCI